MKHSLNSIIIDAYSTVTYYKNLFTKYNIDPSQIRSEDDLEQLPILKKEDIISNIGDFISNKFDLDALIVEKTSGSTGIPFNIYKSKEDKALQGYFLWKYRNKRFNIDTKANYCTWHIKGSNVFKKDNRLQFSAIKLSDDDLKLYSKSLMQHQPQWLFGSAEAWKILSRYMKKNNYTSPKSLKMIETTGEFLREDTAFELEEFFNCPVVNMYGCIETYGIAVSCKNSNLHIIEENVIVEIVNDSGENIEDGNFGNVIITSLNNNAMPLIRYSLGDVGRIINTKCDCEMNAKYLELKSARINEKISMQNAEHIDSSLFHFVIERINRYPDLTVLQFKVIQDDYDSFKLYVVLKNNSKYLLDKFKEQFMFELSFYNLDQCKWEIIYMDKIGLNMLTGKYQYFVNNVDKIKY